MTFQPRARNNLALARPKPEEQPVMSTVLVMGSPLLVRTQIAAPPWTSYKRQSEFRYRESEMDALAAVVTLLKPQTILSKVVRGGGRWGVRYPAFGQPSFALVMQGPCWLTAEKSRPTLLEAGDFACFQRRPGFTLASDLQVKPKALQTIPTEHVDEVVHGDLSEAPSVSSAGRLLRVRSDQRVDAGRSAAADVAHPGQRSGEQERRAHRGAHQTGGERQASRVRRWC